MFVIPPLAVRRAALRAVCSCSGDQMLLPLLQHAFFRSFRAASDAATKIFEHVLTFSMGQEKHRNPCTLQDSNIRKQTSRSDSRSLAALSSAAAFCPLYSSPSTDCSCLRRNRSSSACSCADRDSASATAWQYTSLSRRR